MGIRIQHHVLDLPEEEFHRLDYRVMAMAFQLHNSIGNLWDEIDYKTRLLELCMASGMQAATEVQIAVSHKEFQKSYFIDLLIEGIVYELKTASGITPAHEAQALNYLFLTNTRHGKIINLRPDSLEWRFVSTSLTAEQRKSFSHEMENWHPDDPASATIPELLMELLDDWGAWLDLNLYKEAVLFFLERPPEDVRKRFCPLSTETLVHFTALSRKKDSYLGNLRKYLAASTYRNIDWINFDRNKIELRTLEK